MIIYILISILDCCTHNFQFLPTMKHKRQKHAKKVMTFYEKHFGLTPPYNILVDATFVKEALANKVNIWDQLPNYLCANVRLYTTTCALRELEAFGLYCLVVFCLQDEKHFLSF